MSLPDEKLSEDRFEEKEDRLPYGSDYAEDPILESRVTRKLDFHILPWIFTLCLLAFIDRSNIGEIQVQSSKPPRPSLTH